MAIPAEVDDSGSVASAVTGLSNSIFCFTPLAFLAALSHLLYTAIQEKSGLLVSTSWCIMVADGEP